MCGIAGIIRKNRTVTYDQIETLTNSMYHRGPDGEGVYVKDNYAIGHRRLSIIDLSNGTQPMHSKDGLYHITYNGELYNYHEIRAELEKSGFIFCTSSDTEVVLNSYIRWGKDCVIKFRGMFAFAVADEKRKHFFVARDSLGIKPLVIYKDNECIAFCSELKTLKLLENFNKEIDIQAIDQFLAFQYIPAPRTIYQHAKKLMPGHYMLIGFDFSVSDQIPFYKFSFETNDINKNEETYREYIKKYDLLMRESVEKHLQADVDYGAFLSGGIDSTLVVDYMSQILDKPVKTFSIGFEGDDYSELDYAKLASEINHTEHHVQIVKGDALSILPELVQHFGEPFGDSSAVPTYYVSKLASNSVKMVLSGDGADELFTGYRRYLSFSQDHSWNGGNYIKHQIRKKGEKIKDTLLSNSSWNKYYDYRFEQMVGLIRYFPRDLREKLWKKEYLLDTCDTEAAYYKRYKECIGKTKIQMAQYLDINEYLPNAILSKVDIASMMCSLEVRTPFVDKKVLEFALNTPEFFNMRNIDEFGLQGKMLLKENLAKKYPKDFLFRTKRGFSMPLHIWFQDPTNYAYKKKMELTSKDAKISQYFDMSAINKVINDKTPGPIWLLMFLEEWLVQNT